MNKGRMQDVTLDVGRRAAAALHQRPAWRQWNEAGRRETSVPSDPMQLADNLFH